MTPHTAGIYLPSSQLMHAHMYFGFSKSGSSLVKFSFCIFNSLLSTPTEYLSLAERDQDSSVPKICQMSDHLLIKKKPLKIITGLFCYSCVVKELRAHCLSSSDLGAPSTLNTARLPLREFSPHWEEFSAIPNGVGPALSGFVSCQHRTGLTTPQPPTLCCSQGGPITCGWRWLLPPLVRRLGSDSHELEQAQ